MNTITIEYSDGSAATWFIPDDDLDSIGTVEDALVEVAGQPDSIKA